MEETSEKHGMTVPSLIKAVTNLRFVASHDLGGACYIFPKLDDFDAIETWKSGTVACWPRARCLLDRDGDDEGCFRIDLEVLPKEDDDHGGQQEENAQDPTESKAGDESAYRLEAINAKPLSSIVDELFGTKDPLTEGSGRPLIKTRRKSSAKVVTRRDVLQHLYGGPIEAETLPAAGEESLRLKKHANFTTFFGLVQGNLAEYCLTRSSDLTIGSFSKFNRHVLRLFSRSDEFEELHGDADSASPALIGANPIVDGECDAPARFLFFQCVQAIEYLHEIGPHGALCPDAISVTDDLWVEMRPPALSRRVEGTSFDTARNKSESVLVVNETKEWRDGRLSNFEYLLKVNAAAGRRTGGCGAFCAILPWVKDFESGKPRDLRRSKFRLKKGDKQLDTTFNGSSELAPQRLLDLRRGEMPHHIPESLSELTYYVYAARTSPIRALQKVVRHNFEPKEYPASMARLYEWTPDECVPEFFVDPGLFLPNNGLNCLLCGKSKQAHEEEKDVEEPREFLLDHAQYLETGCATADLAAWIDLNFGAALHGRLAVENKNVVLVPTKQRLEPFQLRKSPEFIRLFDRPHPTSKLHEQKVVKTAKPTLTLSGERMEESKQREDEFLLHVFQAMLAPRDGLKVRVQYERSGNLTVSSVPVAFGGQATSAGTPTGSAGQSTMTTSANFPSAFPPPGGLTNANIASATAAVPSVAADLGLSEGFGGTEPTKSTFLGSDLVEWLVRRQIPGVASTSDAVALARRMMSAGFFVPERQGADDDFVDADDAYRFRERREVLKKDHHSHSHHVGGNIVVPRPFGGTEMFDAVDSGLGGLFGVATYYPAKPDDDAKALGMIISELYLGRPARNTADLDVLPVPVAAALRKLMFEAGDMDMHQLLYNETLFPRHFHSVWSFLSAVHMANPGDRWKQFCESLPDLDVFGNNRQEAVWLILPTAYKLMRSDGLDHLGQMFITMRPFVQDDSLMRSLVEACFANADSSSSTMTVDGPDWAKYLPAEMFLDHFIDLYVSSKGECKSVERGLKIGMEGKSGLTRRAVALIKGKASALLAQELLRRLEVTSVGARSTETMTTGGGVRRQQDNPRASQQSSDWLDEDGNNSEDEGTTAAPGEGGDSNNNSLDASMLSVSEAVKPVPPSVTQPLASTSTNFRRAVYSRFLAHQDAMVTSMAVASDGSPRFVTGSRRVEVVLWGWDDHGAFESCRFRASDSDLQFPAVHTVRFLASSSNRIMVGTSKNLGFSQPTAAVFDLGKGSAQRTSSRFSGVRCFEPFGASASSDVVCLGAETDVVLADLRTSRFVSRFCIPSSSANVRCLWTSSSSIVCALNERMVELEPRMVGKVVREWKTIGKVTRLFSMEQHGPEEGRRLLLSVVRGGFGASVWDLSASFSSQPKERLRAFTGFDEDTVPDVVSSVTSVGGGSLTAPNTPVSGPAVPLTMPRPDQSASLSSSLPSTSSTASLLFPTVVPGSAAMTSTMMASSFQVENMDDWDSLVALTSLQDSTTGTEGPFLYVVRGTHKLARIPLKVHDSPLEVRVRPLSLTQLGSSKRYKYGGVSLTSACQIPGEMLMVAGHDVGGTAGTDGSYIHALV